jgi:hypothetical protein
MTTVENLINSLADSQYDFRGFLQASIALPVLGIFLAVIFDCD